MKGGLAICLCWVESQLFFDFFHFSICKRFFIIIFKNRKKIRRLRQNLKKKQAFHIPGTRCSQLDRRRRNRTRVRLKYAPGDPPSDAANKYYTSNPGLTASKADSISSFVQNCCQDWRQWGNIPRGDDFGFDFPPPQSIGPGLVPVNFVFSSTKLGVNCYYDRGGMSVSDLVRVFPFFLNKSCRFLELYYAHMHTECFHVSSVLNSCERDNEQLWYLQSIETSISSKHNSSWTVLLE